MLLEALLVLPPEDTLAGLREVLGRLRGDRCHEGVAGMISHLAGPDMAPEARALLVESAAACPQATLPTTMEAILEPIS